MPLSGHDWFAWMMKSRSLPNEETVHGLLEDMEKAPYTDLQSKARRAPAQASRAVYHQHAAARGLAPAGLYRAPDDGPGTAVV